MPRDSRNRTRSSRLKGALRPHRDRIAEPHRPRAVPVPSRTLQQPLAVLAQGRVQVLDVLTALANEALELGHLVNAERPLHLGRPEVVAQVHEQEALVDAGVRDVGLVLDVARPAVRAQHAGQVGDQIVVGDDHPALDRADVVREVEAEGAHDAEGAGRAALESRAVGLAGVLDDVQPVATGQLAQRPHVAGVAQQVHRHQRPRARPDGPLDRGGIEREGLEIHVDQHRHQPHVHQRVVGRGPRHRRDDDLVTRAQAVGERGVDQHGRGHQVGRGAGVHHDGVADAEVLGPHRLEAAHLLAHGDPGGQQRGDRLVDLVGPVGGNVQGQLRGAGGRRRRLGEVLARPARECGRPAPCARRSSSVHPGPS